MTTTTTPKRASRSGNPATAAAAKRDAAAKRAAEIEAEAEVRRHREEAQARAAAEFKAMVLPAPEFDADGYEVIPDRSLLEGQSYKFIVDGKRYVLPNLQYLPVNLALGGKSEDEVHAAIFGKYAPDLLDHCSADQMKHIFKRWTEYSKGVGLGE